MGVIGNERRQMFIWQADGGNLRCDIFKEGDQNDRKC